MFDKWSCSFAGWLPPGKRFQDASLLERVAWISATALLIWQVPFLLRLLRTPFMGDELLLLQSFHHHHIFNLAFSTLEHNQAVGLFYALFVEGWTSVFGTTIIAGRVISLFCWFILLFLISSLLKKSVSPSWRPVTILFAVLIGFLPMVYRYAWIFKPYLLDSICMVVIAILYERYRNNRISPARWTVLLCLTLLFSIPACFFVGGVLLMETGSSLVVGDRVRLQRILVVAVTVAACFSLHYFFWLGKHDNMFMAMFWRPDTFPVTNLSKIQDVFFELWGKEFGPFRKLALYFALGGTCTSLLNLRRVDRQVLLALVVGFLMSLVASSLGKYPVSPRLFLFIYPLFSILVFVFFQDVLNFLARGRCPALWIAAFLVVSLLLIRSSNSILYEDALQRIKYGDTVRKALRHVHDPRCETRPIFFWTEMDFSGFPLADMKLSPDVRLVSCQRDLIPVTPIPRPGCEPDAGRPLTSPPAPRLESVPDHARQDCWVIVKTDDGIGHHRKDDLYYDSLVFGYLPFSDFREMVYSRYNILLYHLVSDCSRLETKVTYTLEKYEQKANTVTATIRITNVGETLLNATTESVVLAVSDSPFRFAIPRKIPPGESVSIRIAFPRTPDKRQTAQLVNEGRYTFGQLGVPPLLLTSSAVAKEVPTDH